MKVAPHSLQSAEVRSYRAHGSQTAAWALAFLLASIMLGPPVTIMEDIEVRPQDVIVGLTVVWLVIVRRWPRSTGLQEVLGMTPILFLGGALALTWVYAAIGREVGLRYLGFLGRSLELIVLSATVAALFKLAGVRGFATVRRTVYFAAAVNACWLVWQYLSGSSETLFGNAAAASYGGRLVGDPAVFAGGTLLVFVAIVALSEWSDGAIAPVTTLCVVAAVAALCIHVQSRSALAALVAVIGVSVAWGVRRRSLFWTGVAIVIAAIPLALMAGMGATYSPSGLATNGRLSPTGISDSFGYRIREIWTDLWSVAGEHLFLGIGPGSLGTPEFPYTEAHNVLLRAMLDYGLLVGALFLALFFRAGWSGLRLALSSAGYEVSIYARMTALMITYILVAGVVQDAATPVMSTHLTFFSIGLLSGAVAKRGRREEHLDMAVNGATARTRRG